MEYDDYQQIGDGLVRCLPDHAVFVLVYGNPNKPGAHVISSFRKKESILGLLQIAVESTSKGRHGPIVSYSESDDA